MWVGGEWWRSGGQAIRRGPAAGSGPPRAGRENRRGRQGGGSRFSSARLARQAEDALTEDVAHDVRRAAHDRVPGRVDEPLDDVVPQRRRRAEDPRDKGGDTLFVLGAEALRRR